MKTDIVVCVGTGGVGKTTIAATLALCTVQQGKRTLVLTIDPARRLANALGLRDGGPEVAEITTETLADSGIVAAHPLHVSMPNTQTTFDDLISRIAKTDLQRQQILNNRIYRYFSTVLPGVHEYAAVEKLYDFYTSGAYDQIIVDTPPSQNALDFLEAPQRIIDFVDNETFRLLLKPTAIAGKLSLKLLDFSSSVVLRTLGNLAGTETLKELAQFIMMFHGLYDGFRDRSKSVRDILRSPDVSFVLITSPQPSQAKAALEFAQTLHQQNVSIDTVIINRAHEFAAPQTITERHALPWRDLQLDNAEFSAIVSALKEEQWRTQNDQLSIQKVTKQLPTVRIVTLPEQIDDIHNLVGLKKMTDLYTARFTASSEP